MTVSSSSGCEPMLWKADGALGSRGVVGSSSVLGAVLLTHVPRSFYTVAELGERSVATDHTSWAGFFPAAGKNPARSSPANTPRPAPVSLRHHR